MRFFIRQELHNIRQQAETRLYKAGCAQSLSTMQLHNADRRSVFRWHCEV